MPAGLFGMGLGRAFRKASNGPGPNDLLLMDFSSDIADHSLQPLSATAVGAVSLSSEQSLYAGKQALKCEGGYVRVDGASAMAFGANQPFTIRFHTWIPTITSSGRAFINLGAWPDGSSSFMFYIGGGAELALYGSTNGSSWNFASDLRLANGGTYPRDTWIELAVSRDENGVVRGFCQGVQGFSFTNSAALAPNSVLTIGAGSNGGGALSTGWIQRLSIRSTCDITGNYVPPVIPLY